MTLILQWVESLLQRRGETISIHREYGVALLRRMKVVIDDQQAGWVRNGSTLDVQVAPGPHTVQVRMDWQRSTPVTITLQDGQRVVLRARMDLRSQSIAGFVLKPHEALDLDVLDGS